MERIDVYENKVNTKYDYNDKSENDVDIVYNVKMNSKTGNILYVKKSVGEGYDMLDKVIADLLPSVYPII